MRRIALAASAMNQLGRVWRQRNLSLTTKLHPYETCVLQCSCTAPRHGPCSRRDVDRLQAFHTCAACAVYLENSLVRLCNECRGEGPHSPGGHGAQDSALEDLLSSGMWPACSRGFQPTTPLDRTRSSLWQCSRSRLEATPWPPSGPPGRSSSGGTSMAWASGRPGIWLWIGIDGGSSLRAFAAHA